MNQTAPSAMGRTEAFSRGHIKLLNPAGSFGLIETADGRQVRFHRTSVIGMDYRKLRTGDTVRFGASNDDMERCASTVFLADREEDTQW